MLAAKALWDIPVFALTADTFTDGTSAWEWRVVGSLPPEKVTVTFRAFLGFRWRFIATGYFSIRTTSMTQAACPPANRDADRTSTEKVRSMKMSVFWDFC